MKAFGIVLCAAALAMAALNCTGGPGGSGTGSWTPPWAAPSNAPSPGDPALGAGVESFTILLGRPYMGVNHVRDASDDKKRAEESTHWKEGLFVVHEEKSSSLYFGHYADAEKAGKELAKIRAWKGDGGTQPFALAIVAKLAGERVGPPAWDLANAKDPNWAYTVVVAEYYNVPEDGFTTRKEVAVDKCRDLRAHGVEAFFFHGPSVSVITVGVYPVTAFRTETMANGTRQDVFESDALKKTMHDFPLLLFNKFKVKEKGSNKWEGTYVTAVSDYCPSNEAPLPKNWRYEHPRSIPAGR